MSSFLLRDMLVLERTIQVYNNPRKAKFQDRVAMKACLGISGIRKLGY